ncbi:MAG: ATP-binding cassette domain-containing protein [Propionibacteriaceae bacterium]|jgi:zinc transport system ATP-binding protein|nr:ATP-binding cassette domain-containing protein [Propionibacteriaceae bacterium]
MLLSGRTADPAAGETDGDSTPDLVEIQDLGVSLDGLPVLRQVWLTVPAGQAVALLGNNGSGKTTLVRALLGLTPHQAGAIRLFGAPAVRSGMSRRDGFHSWWRIGYVPQQVAISLHATTLAEVVRTGALAHRHDAVWGVTSWLHRRHARQVVAQALDQVGLTAQAKELFIHLSGGQQRRALIARALAQQPDLLVLDEPLAGVDLAHQGLIRDVLAGFRERGGAILVVLHETEALAPLIDRAVVLRDGRVVHDGPLPTDPETHWGHELEAPPRAAGLMTGLGPHWER